MSPPWQMPVGGLTQQEREAFRKYIDFTTAPGHMLWTGPSANDRGIFFLRGCYVAASRISCAMQHPDRPIPGRLFRGCAYDQCIAPGCFANAAAIQASAKPAPAEFHRPAPPLGELIELSGPTINPVALGGDLRTVEAMAAIQFGLPIEPRPLRKLVTRTTPESVARRTELAALDVEVIADGPGADQLVERPAGMRSYVPNVEEAQAAPRITSGQVLAILNRPGVTFMHFSSGHVWLITPEVKLDADTLEEAILGYLIATGKHAVKG